QKGYNLQTPILDHDFVVLDFTYDMPLTTFLGQVLNNSAKIPKHFCFNRILIDKNPMGDLELYALSKRHQLVMKVTIDAKASPLTKTNHH
ncbi:two-component system activity regulator YycH, partial [Staphylococcus hominis]|uniref:two-component system activity regulator YycH n=1 Tax=Staphylococcus hominis TaxID=1290 RepID=UPI00210EAE42